MAITRPKMIAMIVACAFFMQNLDGTIVATALPPIALNFNVSPVQLSSVITAYLLTVAVCIPISAWTADRFGGANVFRAAVAVFTLGSILCGIANGVTELVLARVVQGVGGAMMIPVGRLVLLRSVTKAEFVETMTYLMVPAQVGMVLGPVVGGWITTYASWRWIFLMNVPIGLLGIYMVTRYIPNVREGERYTLDWLGFLLTGIALASLMYGLEGLRDPSPEPVTIGALVVVGLVVGAVAYRHLRTHPHPIIDLSLYKTPTFWVSFWGGTPFRLAWGSCAFMLPLLFQVAMGMTAFQSGVLIFTNAIGNVTMKTACRHVLKRFGFRTVVTVNAGLCAVGMVACGMFGLGTPAYVIVLCLFLNGFSQSLQFTSLNTLAYADLGPTKMSGATSLAQMGQQLSNVFGVAIAAVMLQALLVTRGEAKLTVMDFHIVFAIVAVIALSSLPFMRQLKPDAAAEISGHRPAHAQPAE